MSADDVCASILISTCGEQLRHEQDAVLLLRTASNPLEQALPKGCRTSCCYCWTAPSFPCRWCAYPAQCWQQCCKVQGACTISQRRWHVASMLKHNIPNSSARHALSSLLSFTACSNKLMQGTYYGCWLPMTMHRKQKRATSTILSMSFMYDHATSASRH
eukprot:350266-Chlamydomonas_euryale.AAC.15